MLIFENHDHETISIFVYSYSYFLMINNMIILINFAFESHFFNVDSYLNYAIELDMRSCAKMNDANILNISLAMTFCNAIAFR